VLKEIAGGHKIADPALEYSTCRLPLPKFELLPCGIRMKIKHANYTLCPTEDNERSRIAWIESDAQNQSEKLGDTARLGS